MDIAHVQPEHVALGFDEGRHGGLGAPAIAVNRLLDVGAGLASQREFDFSLPVLVHLDERRMRLEHGSLTNQVGASVRNPLGRTLGQLDAVEALDHLENGFVVGQSQTRPVPVAERREYAR